MWKISLLNLARRKSRTALALAGIIIGIMAIVALIAVVDGTNKEFSDIVSQMQGIQVKQKGTYDEAYSRIDKSYLDEMAKIRGVSLIMAEVTGAASKIDDKISQSMLGFIGVYGVDAKTFSRMGISQTFKIIKGRNLEANDSKKVLISEDIADTHNKFVGSNIKIDKENFTVKGIYTQESQLVQQIIVIPIADAKEMIGVPDDKINSIRIDLINPEDDQRIAQEIEFKFGDKLVATTTSDLSKQFGAIIDNFRLLVLVIAGFSAIVAGIGIANTMLMSVMERFKEIGALKAVGWTAYQIVQMILLESMYIGIFGGIIGIIFGYGASIGLGQFGLTAFVSVELIIQSFLFALAVSILAGLYPAYVASRMNPVDTLREE